jgi:hypothetical protein
MYIGRIYLAVIIVTNSEIIEIKQVISHFQIIDINTYDWFVLHV